jgi:sugar phosphate isomerase/epimerase
MTTPRIGITAMKARGRITELHRLLDEIEPLGVDSVELPVYDLDLLAGARQIAPHMRLFREAIRGRPFGTSVHGPHPTNFFDPEEISKRHLEVVTAMLDIAAEAGSGHFVIHTGFMKRGSPGQTEDAYARQREWLARAGDAARPLGITVCVENVFDWEWGGLETALPSRLAAEIAAVAHPNVRATLDVGHAQLEAGMRGRDPVEEIAALAPHAVHIHAHDNFGRPDDIYMYLDGERLAYGHGDLHLPVGWGSTPWEEILARCVFPSGLLINVELTARYWHAAAQSVAAARALAPRVRLAGEGRA